MNILDILNSLWAIAPEKLNEICAIYAAHRNGEQADFKAIEAALGKPLGPGGAKAYTVQDGVAILPLEGVLSKRMSLFSQISGGQSYQSFQRELQQALDDPQVSAIILTIDSPGGQVDGAQAAADAIYAARRVKPIYAHVNGMAASAAYWLGSSASKVYIGSDTDQVGSIGVVTQHVDTSNAEHQRGVKITEIAAGRYKTVGSQHSPLSATDRNLIQDQLDHVYGVFVDSVARNRGVKVDAVLSKMADGRVFVGQKAIDAGLVDGKSTLSALIAKLGTGNRNSSAANSVRKRVQPTDPVRGSDSATPISASAVPPAARNPTAPLTDAEVKVNKLRPLKLEEIAKRRLLNDEVEVAATARHAIWQAQRAGKSAEEILPFVESLHRSEATQRSLKHQLASIEDAQLAILRG